MNALVAIGAVLFGLFGMFGIAILRDVVTRKIERPDLCAICQRLKNDSTMHFDAPGGAALHWFQGKEK